MKLGLMGTEIDYYIVEGKTYNHRYFIKVIIQSYDFKDISIEYRDIGDTYTQKEIIPSDASFWVEVTKEEFGIACEVNAW